MKKKYILFITILFLNYLNSQAQVQFWSDTFEDVGAPSSGSRTPENNGGTGSPLYDSYFARVNNNGIDTSNTPNGYTNIEGTKFWAGEDHDTAFNAGNEEQEIVWSGINISGKSNLRFSGFFAANNLSAAFESTAFGFTTSDYVILEYSIGSGNVTYTPLLRFYANNNDTSLPNTNKRSLALDTDNNNIGDGTILTYAFQNFDVSIPATGTILNLRMRAFSNGLREEWAIDNFRLYENALGTDDFESNKFVTVYPNPAKNNFRILSQKDASITIYNQLGQSVKQLSVSQNVETLITNEGLSNGMYFLVGTTSDGKKFNEKIIFQK